MARPINYRIPKDELVVTIGGLDFSKCVAEFTIQRPLPDIQTPYSWTGSMKLVNPIYPSDRPESLNDLENPTRWAKGAHPVVIRVGSNTIATLRITDYFYDDAPRKPYGDCQLADVLTLFDFDTPPQAWQRLISGNSLFTYNTISPAKMVEKTLESLGLSVDLSAVPSTVALPTARDKPQGSLIKWAQTMLGERGYWLYVSETEQIKAVKYPTHVTSVLFSRSLKQVSSFSRRRGVERPIEHIVVSGACEYERPASSGGTTSDQPFALPRYEYDEESGALIRITSTSIESDSKGNYACKTTVQEALAVMNESLFRNEYVQEWVMVTSLVTTETKTADSQGRVIQETRTVERPLGAALSDLLTDLAAKNAPKGANDAATAVNQAVTARPYYFSDLITADDELKTYTYENGVMVEAVRTLVKLFRFDELSYAARVAEYEIDQYGATRITAVLGSNVVPPPRQYFRHYELWRRSASKAVKIARKDVIPRKVVKWYFPRPLTLVETQDFRNAQPPKSDETRPDFETGSIPIMGEAKFKIPGATQFCKQREDYNFETLSTSDECRKLAQLLGNIKYQGYYGRQYVLPPPQEWLQSSRPFTFQAIHNRIFVGCGEVLTLNNKRLQLAFDGYDIGAIAPVPDPDEGVSYSFSPPVPLYEVELTAGYALTLTCTPSGAIVNAPSTLTSSVSSGYTLTYTKSDSIVFAQFEQLVISERIVSGYGGGATYVARTIAYRTSGPPTGWNTPTLTYTAPDGLVRSPNRDFNSTWQQVDGDGNPTNPTTLILYSWVISEQYTGGGGYGYGSGGAAYRTLTLIYDPAGPPTGWNTGVLTYKNPDGNTVSLYNVMSGGTWQQKDNSGNPTTPTIYSY